MTEVLIYLFLTVLVFCIMNRLVLKKDTYADGMPRSILAGFVGLIWPISLPSLVFGWAINKVLDKFTKV